MSVYIFFFAVLLFGLFSRRNTGTNIFLWLTIFFLWLIIGFRDITVGADTLSYVEDFTRYSRMDIHEIYREAFSRSEPLYVFISWLPSLISSNYTLYLLVWALFPAIALFRLFKTELEDNKDFSLAFVVCFILGLFAFYVAGIRQTAAMSIILWGYPYFKNIKLKGIFRKGRFHYLLKFLLCMVAAYLIHNSSIVFILAFLLKGFEAKWYYLFIALATFFLADFLGLEQITLLSSALFGERFETYGTIYESAQSSSAFFMQLILFLICVFRRNVLLEKDKDNNFLFNAMLLGLVFQSLSGHLAEMARVSFFFCSFAMILVPRALKEYKDKAIGPAINYSFFIVCVIYLFFLSDSNLPDYHTVLWQ